MKASFIFAVVVFFNVLCLDAYSQNTSDSTKYFIDLAIKFQRSNPDSAMEYSSKGLKLAVFENDKWAIGRINAITGRTKELSGNKVDALISYFESLEYLESADTTDYYTAYSVARNIAAIHNSYRLHDVAIEYYDKATNYLKLHLKYYPNEAQKYKDHLKIYDLAYYKYLNHHRLGSVESAVEGFMLLIDDKTAPIKVRLKSHNRLALIMSELGDSEASILSFHKIINNSESDELTKARALHHIGAEYFKLGDFNQSMKFYSKAIELKETLTDQESLFMSYLDMGETLMKLEQTNQAIMFLNKALSLNIDLEDFPDRFIIHQLLGLALIDTESSTAKFHLNSFAHFSREYQKKGRKLEEESKKRELVARVNQYYQIKENEKVLNEKNRFHSRQLWLLFSLVVISLLLTVWLMKKWDKQKRKAFFQALQNTGLD